MSKSSGVAKAGLVTGIIGTSLAGILASQGCGGRNGGNGGLLGNLFGGNNCGLTPAEGMQSIYDQTRMAQGAQAQTEVDMLTKYIMPLGQQVCALQAEAAVNREREEKNQVINGLLFRLADQKAENLFERAQCCCEKNGIRIENVYDRLAEADRCNYERLAAATQCAYDRLAADNACNYNRLDAKIDCTADKATMRTDATFALRKAQVDAQIAQEMCGVIKGKPYLSPCQMADPYMGGQNLLRSRQVVPVTAAVSTFSNDCGCSDWAW